MRGPGTLQTPTAHAAGCCPGPAALPDGVRQETQAPGQLDLLPEGQRSNGPLEGDGDGPVAQVELAERHLAGLRQELGLAGVAAAPQAAPTPPPAEPGPTSLKASLNSPPGAMPSCSVMWADTFSSSICMSPDMTPFCRDREPGSAP